jgi:peptide/nickel transport system substrate-binding protein
MELSAFDGYYQGKPNIDRIFLKVILDPTAMVANILAGAVDVVVPPGVDLETAADIKSRWQGTGNQVIVGGFEDMNSSYTLQFRPEYVKPKSGGTTNRDVREALLRGIDRPLMTETITAGLALVADSWVSPNHRLRGELESAIPQYPYDLNRAQQLLAQAGWTRGSDGILVNADGEKMEIELAGPVRTALQKQQAIISDGWKPLGVVGQIYVVSAVDDQNAETRSIRPATYLGSIAADRYYFEDQLHSREITTPANWGRRNRGGYSSPALDASLDKLRATIDNRERVAGYRDQLRIAMGDVALWPLYWDVYPVLAVAGVKADVIHPAKGGVMANILEWDRN